MQGAFPTVVTSDADVIQDICLRKFRFFHSRMTDPTSGDPDKLREVHVFAARGERWKRIRSLTSPAFSNQNLKKDNNNSTPIELHRYHFPHLSNWLTFRPCRCLPEWSALLSLYSSLRSQIRRMLRLQPDPLQVYAQKLYAIAERREKSDEHYDFLQFLKNVEDNEWEGWMTINDVQTDMNTVKIPKKMIRELREEIDNAGEACFDTVQRMKYLHWAISETLRLFPHASL
uniref:Cytochrome P450 n=1 Tax=Parascaris equorum TaxID=6256 RepID=A0A914RK00_PAREQ